jgi:hypothetical protein
MITFLSGGGAEIMCRNLWLSLALSIGLTSQLFALSIGQSGSSSPFVISFDGNAQSSYELILQAVNESQTDAAVVAWQLDLELQPLPGSQGALLFQNAEAPPNSLFGQTPGPMTDLAEPSAAVFAFDSDSVDFEGEVVAGQSFRNILQLSLAASPNSVGSFQLVTPVFDPQNPDTGSAWFAAGAAEPEPFGNSSPGQSAGFTLLGTINVTQASSPGDYDHDGVVGPLDYERWRTHFGDTVSSAGDVADGNGNLVIDSADYVIWRAAVPANPPSTSSFAKTSVPEPTATTLALAGLISLMATSPNRFA